MNHVAFKLGEPIFWHLAQQEQIEALLETSQSSAVGGDFYATGRIQQIFEEAISRRFSDIHLEPKKNLRIRYRIDGYLHDAASIPLSFHPLILSRLKLLAGMDIAVRRRPQDGN